MTVVWHHWIYIFPGVTVPWYLVPVVSGHEAVVLFFVLSGYVLALPLWSGRAQSYKQYVARRIGRIYLPYLAAATLAAVGCWLFGGARLPLAPWFYNTWHTRLTAKVLLSQAVMSPKPVLNIAFWSLSYEMAISLLFPAAGWLMVRSGPYSCWVFLFVVKSADFVLARYGWKQTYLEAMLYYMMFFALGSCVARERQRLLALLARAKRGWLWLGLAASLAAYYSLWLGEHDVRRGDQLIALGAAGIIVLVQDSRIGLFLKTAPAQFLGRISYSLYLIHGTVLYVLLITCYRRMPTILVAVLYGVLAVSLSFLFCMAIEEPSHRLGKRAAAKLQQGAPDGSRSPGLQGSLGDPYRHGVDLQ